MILHLLTIFVLTEVVLSQSPSPCPEILSYEPRTDSDRWYGIITLTTDVDLTGIWLHINLDRPAELLGNWFGDATSSDNTEYVIRNSKYKLEAGPPVLVRFFVKYNTATTIPSVKTIRLNGKTICTSQKDDESRPTEPPLHISHVKPTSSESNSRPSSNNGGSRPSSNGNSGATLSNNNSNGNNNSGGNGNNGRPGSRPGGNRRPGETSASNTGSSNRPTSSDTGSGLLVIQANDSDNDSDFFPGDFAIIQSPSQKRPSVRPLQGGNRSPGCGVVASRVSPLISHGQDTAPGQWPWHAALYLSRGLQLMYTCGATLISEQHVLTAAHCVTKSQTNVALNPTSILIYLGKYNLGSFGSDIQDRDVSKIFVHPEYNATVYFNDVAVLKLSRPVTLTNIVRPCCLWDEESDVENLINRQGTVVGWGFDENGNLSNNLMQAQMPIVSTVTCIYSNRDFFSQFTFEKNFCAGFRNGTSVCNGDSGGGMVFPKKGTSGQNTVWQIRGIVSVGVALQGKGICDTSQYIVFTDVAKYTRWIRQVLSN